jgi:transcription antitermination factor NusG
MWDKCAIVSKKAHWGIQEVSEIILTERTESNMPIDEPKPAVLPWYAIRVRSKFEKMVSTSLSGKGYHDYLPLYRSRRNWSDRSKELDLPLFPGYLFCRLDVEKRLPILTTPGVISIVGMGKIPVSISEQEIEAIRIVVHSGLPILPWPRLTVGTRVVIEKGPLKGIEGVTLDVDRKFRLLVSVALLQRSVSVEIDRDWARPLPG